MSQYTRNIFDEIAHCKEKILTVQKVWYYQSQQLKTVEKTRYALNEKLYQTIDDKAVQLIEIEIHCEDLRIKGMKDILENLYNNHQTYLKKLSVLKKKANTGETAKDLPGSHNSGLMWDQFKELSN